MQSKLNKLREAISIQHLDGNYNYDEYNFGMLNGLILSESIFTGEDPIFQTKPKKFIINKTRKMTLLNWLWCILAGVWIMNGIIIIAKL